MLAGQAHEIEARFHRGTPESEARNAAHYRAATEARAEQRGAGGQQPRLPLQERLAASLRALATPVSAMLR